MSLLTDGRKLFFLVHLQKTVQSDECDTISVDRRHVFTDRREKALLPGSSSENCTADECDTISVDRRHVFTDRREKALLPGSSSENCTVRRV